MKIAVEFLSEIENFDSLIIDRYSIKYIKEELKKKDSFSCLLDTSGIRRKDRLQN